MADSNTTDSRTRTTKTAPTITYKPVLPFLARRRMDKLAKSSSRDWHAGRARIDEQRDMYRFDESGVLINIGRSHGGLRARGDYELERQFIADRRRKREEEARAAAEEEAARAERELIEREEREEAERRAEEELDMAFE